jgi:hypothetical protein
MTKNNSLRRGDGNKPQISPSGWSITRLHATTLSVSVYSMRWIWFRCRTHVDPTRKRWRSCSARTGAIERHARPTLYTADADENWLLSDRSEKFSMVV